MFKIVYKQFQVSNWSENLKSLNNSYAFYQNKVQIHYTPRNYAKMETGTKVQVRRTLWSTGKIVDQSEHRIQAHMDQRAHMLEV